MLVASLVGLDSRATVDIDTTIKGFSLTPETAKRVVEEVAAIPVDDDMTFIVEHADQIMDEAEYAVFVLRLRHYSEKHAFR